MRSPQALSLLFYFVALTSISVACVGDRTNSQPNGPHLQARLTVFELQGGVAGLTGTYYLIEPDGSWEIGPVMPPGDRRGEATARGNPNQARMQVLVEKLAEEDLANLPDHGEPAVNPRVIRVQVGDRVSELQPQAGPSAAGEDRAIRNRYAEIVTAVKAYCRTP